MIEQLELFPLNDPDVRNLRDPEFLRSVIRMLARGSIPYLRHAAIVDMTMFEPPGMSSVKKDGTMSDKGIERSGKKEAVS